MRLEVLTELKFQETEGLARTCEPVAVGLPLPRGKIFHADSIAILDENDVPQVVQREVTCTWPGGSIRWLLMELCVTVDAGCKRTLRVVWSDAADEARPRALPDQRLPTGPLRIISGQYHLEAPTDRPAFVTAIDAVGAGRLASLDWRVLLTDALGAEHTPSIVDSRLEADGPVRTTLLLRGEFLKDLRFTTRIHYYHGVPLVRIDLQVHNARRAAHKDNLWDLGDPGSFLFRELSVTLSAPADSESAFSVSLVPGAPFVDLPAGGALEILQQSSGGANWRSSNHMDAARAIHRRIPGARVTLDGHAEEHSRLTPTLRWRVGQVQLEVGMREFWQNFPKSLSARDRQVQLSLFPHQEEEIYELQGGEKKTHSFFLAMGEGAATRGRLDWVQSPLAPVIPVGWYVDAGAHPYLTPPGAYDDPRFFSIVNAAIEDGTSFSERRELIDEYGWRNWGDLYGDHESSYKTDGTHFTSHYNNQYDVAYASMVHFWRSADVRWFRLADQVARHVRDIDIYDTDQDRIEYNGGAFWHTNHFLDADTATHRCYSRGHTKPGVAYGGGPSLENTYAAGLFHHYYLTGDRFSLEAAQVLSEFAYHQVGAKKPLKSRVKQSVKLARKAVLNRLLRRTQEFSLWEGPGRESGNALRVLLDAYAHSLEPRYLQAAETLIESCVSPHDDVAAMRLEQADLRGLYLLFLQAMGQYLYVKTCEGKADQRYHHARDTLLHYARWMAEHEHPYLSRPELLDAYINESWAALDIRKCCVLYLASCYAQSEQDRRMFLERVTFFYEHMHADLAQFGKRVLLTRPLVMLLTNGLMLQRDLPDARDAGAKRHDGARASTGWRALLGDSADLPPEAESLAGDIDLLVPLEPSWRALDLSGGYGSRASTLAHRCRETIAVVSSTAEQAILEARAREEGPGSPRLTVRVANGHLPLPPASFDLVILEGNAPWRLEAVCPLLVPGGWLVWFVEAPATPAVSPRHIRRLPTDALNVGRWAAQRALGPGRWRGRLEKAGMTLEQRHIYVREYSWGFLPFDAREAQLYYLESIKEEGQGGARGKTRIARLTGKLGLYPYLVSGYVVVGRKKPAPS